jgi:nicotinate-nucleotide adenylyltransferase
VVRLGVMGGTFNPIHYGHLAAANEVREAFALERIIFVPAAVPPHKDQTAIIEPRHRLMMAILATVSNPHFLVSAIEVDRPGTSYSVETIAALKALYPTIHALYFILGIDAFLEIASWRQPDVLLKSCHLVVTGRPGFNLHQHATIPLQQLSTRYPYLSFEQAEGETSAQLPRVRVSGTPYQIFYREVTALDISSTQIRQRIQQERSIAYLLPETVEAYIRTYQLYR